MARQQAKKQDAKPSPTVTKTTGEKTSRKAGRVRLRLHHATVRRLSAIEDAVGEAYRTSSGKRRAEILDRAERAEFQQARVEKKRAQRQAFAKLSKKEQAAHREAGRRQFQAPEPVES